MLDRIGLVGLRVVAEGYLGLGLVYFWIVRKVTGRRYAA